MQLKFLNQELRSGEFSAVFKALATSDSIRECSDIVCKRFEAPYDTSDGVLTLRASYAREFYDRFTGTPLVTEVSDEEINQSYCDNCFIKELFADILELIEERLHD